jgi:hypothetical protein
MMPNHTKYRALGAKPNPSLSLLFAQTPQYSASQSDFSAAC